MRHLLKPVLTPILAAALAAFWIGTAARAQINASLNAAAEWDNHIEFGISVDPETVSESRPAAQIKGLRFNLNAPLEAQLQNGRLSARFAFSPALDRYAGDDDLLNQFNARLFPLSAALTYQPTDRLPPLQLRAETLRTERANDDYNNWEHSAEWSLGNLLSHRFTRRLFDDPIEREDYLLISSFRHQLQTELQLITRREARLKADYRFQYERYGTNLHPLLRNVALGEEIGFQRNDRRHQINLSAAGLLGRTRLLRLNGSAMFNRSNAPFYRFATYSAGPTLFWSRETNLWARLEAAYGQTRYSERSADGENRADQAWQLNADGEIPLFRFLSAKAAFRLRVNRTSDPREALQFLNYTQYVYTLAIAAKRRDETQIEIPQPLLPGLPILR